MVFAWATGVSKLARRVWLLPLNSQPSQFPLPCCLTDCEVSPSISGVTLGHLATKTMVVANHLHVHCQDLLSQLIQFKNLGIYIRDWTAWFWKIINGMRESTSGIALQVFQELHNGTACQTPAISSGMQSHFGFIPAILHGMVAQWVALLPLSSRLPDLIPISGYCVSRVFQVLHEFPPSSQNKPAGGLSALNWPRVFECPLWCTGVPPRVYSHPAPIQ